MADLSNSKATFDLKRVQPVTLSLLNGQVDIILRALELYGYNLEFSKRDKNYVLEIKKNVNKLDITPTLEDDSASYIIKGNDNLTEGSIIKIIVTAENGARATYQITIKYKSVNYALYIFLVVAVAGVGYIVVKYKGVIKDTYKSLSKKFEVKNSVKNTNVKKSIDRKAPVKNKKTSAKPVVNKEVKKQVTNKNTNTKKKTSKKKKTNKGKKKKTSKKSKKK